MRKLSLFFVIVGTAAAVAVDGASPSARKLSQAAVGATVSGDSYSGSSYGGAYSSGAMYSNNAAFNTVSSMYGRNMMPSNFDAMGAAALADIGTGGSLGLLVTTGEGSADVETANIAVTFKLQAKEFCHHEKYSQYMAALAAAQSVETSSVATATPSALFSVDEFGVNITSTATDAQVQSASSSVSPMAMVCQGDEVTKASSKAAKDVLEAQDNVMSALGAKCLRKTATAIKVKPIKWCWYGCWTIGYEATGMVTCEARRSQAQSCIDSAKGCANQWVSVQVKKVTNIADDQQLAMGEMAAKRKAAANAALEARTLAKAITWMNDDSWHGRENDDAHGGGYPSWMTSDLGSQNYYSSYSVTTNPPRVFNITSTGGTASATGNGPFPSDSGSSPGNSHSNSGPLPGAPGSGSGSGSSGPNIGNDRDNDFRSKQERLQLVALICFPKDEGLGLMGTDNDMYSDDSDEWSQQTYGVSSIDSSLVSSAASMYPYNYPMPPQGIVQEVTVKCVLIVTLNNNEQNKQKHF